MSDPGTCDYCGRAGVVTADARAINGGRIGGRPALWLSPVSGYAWCWSEQECADHVRTKFIDTRRGHGSSAAA